MNAKQILHLNPATFSRERFYELAKKGQADGLVVSFSDYSYSLDAKVIHAVREIGTKLDRPLAVIAAVRGLPQTDKDLLDLQFGIKASADAIVFPINESAGEVTQLRKIIGKSTRRELPIIAGIENARASADFEAVRKAADGILIDPNCMVVPKVLPREPDSEVSGQGDSCRGKIWFSPSGSEKPLTIAQALLHLSRQVDAKVIAVGRLGLAAELSSLRSGTPIVFSSGKEAELNRAALLWGVEPIRPKPDLRARLKAKGLVERGSRWIDATRESSGIIESMA